MRRMKRAFTLVELLVVIAIISVLAALLLPALEGAVKAARQTTCANNQKQWAVAMIAYANDNNDDLPWRWHLAENLSLGTTLTLLEPYELTAELYYCSDYCFTPVQCGTPQVMIGYAYVPYLLWGWPSLTAPVDYGPRKISDIRNKYGWKSVLVADMNKYRTLEGPGFTRPYTTAHGDSNLYGVYRDFGNDMKGTIYTARGINSAFVDGSVRWAVREHWDTSKSIAHYYGPNYLWSKED